MALQTIGTADVLLIVDVQNDFCPGGALVVDGGDTVVPVINRLAQRFQHAVATQDWHPRGHRSFASAHAGRQPFQSIQLDYGEQTLWPDHCVQGTAGAAFHADLDLTRCEMIVRKGFRPEIDSYSGFYENDHETATGLAGYLRERGLKRIFLGGLATDYCVQYSALDAVKEGFETFLVEDACRAIDLDGSAAKALQNMRAAGVGILAASDLGA